MDVLIVLALLAGAALLLSVLGYFLYRTGQWHGARKAYAAITKGIGHHCDTPDGRVPDNLGNATDLAQQATDVQQLLFNLQKVGDAMGYACWDNGYGAGVRAAGPMEDNIQIELTQNQLHALHWVAHIGFKHIMSLPDGESLYKTKDEAELATRTIEILERKLPRPEDDPHALSFGRYTYIMRRWHEA